MPRQKIKLSYHKRSSRYRKMYKGRTYESKVVSADIREERQKAWAEFKLFRSKVDLELSLSDESKPHREFYEPAIQDQQRMAEWYAHEGDKEMLAKTNANIRDLKRAFDNSEPPPTPIYDPNPGGSFGGGSLVWQERYRVLDRIRSNAENDLTIAAQVKRFLTTKARQVKADERSVGRYGKIRNSLEYFMDWHGSEQSVYTLTGLVLQSFYDHLLDKIGDDALARYTARDHLQVVKQFVKNCAALIDDMPFPKILNTKELVINVKGSNEAVVFEPSELQLLVENASSRTKLYLLLMANIGATQIDLSDLLPSEVSLKPGRIVRKRSKTSDIETVPKVNYKLWPSTKALLKKHAVAEGSNALLNRNGGLLVESQIREDGKEKRNDCVRSAYNRVLKKLKNRELIPEDFSKALTDIRKTGADLLAKSEFEAYHQLYLGHATKSVAENHYLKHGAPIPKFDEAIEWLGWKLGLANVEVGN